MSETIKRLNYLFVFICVLCGLIVVFTYTELNQDNGKLSRLLVKNEVEDCVIPLTEQQTSKSVNGFSSSTPPHRLISEKNFEEKGIQPIFKRTCTPRNNIMLLKTHKTGSSTVQNILFRYSLKNNLTVGLPSRSPGDIQFYYRERRKFSRLFLKKSKHTINVICHHMKFNYPEVKAVMPIDTVYVTILRETSSQFESVFDYFHSGVDSFRKVPNKPESIGYWINNTDFYYKGPREPGNWWFAKSCNFYDLGFDNKREDDAYIEYAIKTLETQFQLVMITEYFDESIILLKEIMCWEFTDILYLKKNARAEPKSTMSKSVQEKINKWNKADWMLYVHFNNTFWEKVREYGEERMRKDVILLNKLNDDIKENCLEGGPVANKFVKEKQNKVYNPPGVNMTSFNLKESAKTNETCTNLVKSERGITKDMVNKLLEES